MHLLPRALALVAALALLSAPVRADEAATDKDKEKDKEKPAAKKVLTIAHIKLSGGLDEKPPLVDPLLGSVGETFREKLDRIKKAKNDANVHALLLEIDGLAVGWGKVNELARAIEQFRK